MRRVAYFALLGIVLTGAPGRGQSNLGRIVGTVKDSTGAVVPDTNITVVNEGTGVERRFQSLSTGDYEIPNLVAGAYRVEANQSGFKRFARTGVVLDAGRTVRIDVQLEVGQLSEQVQVRETTPVVETDTPSVSSRLGFDVFSKSAVMVSLRPWEALVTLPTFQSGSAKFVFSVAGGRGAQTEFQVDGISSPKGGSPLGSTAMTMEGTSEMRVQAVNNSAEFSQPGIFQQVSRGGTNELHGDLFYHHDNSALNARSFFNTSKPSNRNHTFGGWLGGPIYIPHVYDGRNRTFFMIATEDAVSPGAANVNATVPTPAMRQGDFSGGKTITDPATGQAFAGNRIPAARLNDVSRRIQDRFYPLPNFGDPSVLTALNHRILFNNSTHAYNADVRVDQKIAANNTLYARFGWIQYNVAVLEGNLPTIGMRSQIRNLRNGVISDTHIFTSAIINEFRLGFQRSRNPFHGPQSGMEVLAAMGIQGVRNVPDAYGIPVVNITGVQSLTQIQQAVNVEQLEQLNNAVSWIRGRHTLKTGVDVRHQDPNNRSVPIGTYGTFDFTGTFTGNAYADFLLGIPQQSRSTFPSPPSYLRQWQYGFFVNDDFKVGPRLTLQLGLRYEYQTPTTQKGDTLYNFDPGSGSVILAAEGARRSVSPIFNRAVPIVVADGTRFPSRQLWRGDKNNFAPRIGFAWRPSGSATFAVRGGFGVYYETLGYYLAGDMMGGPFTPGEELYTNKITGGVPQFQFPQAFPATGAAASTAPPVINAVIPTLRNPYMQQWNLSAEKEVFHVGFRASYIGSKSSQLLFRRNQNSPLPSPVAFSQSRRPYPVFANILLQDQGGNSNYNAFQLEATRRYSSVMFNFGYTWSNLISDVADVGGNSGAIIENPFSRASERAREPYAIKHRFVGNLVWQVPVGKGRRFLSSAPGVVNQVLGGWETVWTTVLRSGDWFTPTFTGLDPSNTNTVGGRADRLADGNISAPTLSRWFDPAAFAAPPANAGRFGTSGRTVLRGPGLAVLHLGLDKKFALDFIREGMRLSFEMAAQNILNHPNFADPIANIRDPNAGKVTGLSGGLELAGSRAIQLRARVSW